jgi:DNA-binding transcriptional LysR family regulator
VDLETVRTFVAVADAGQFSEAADGLSITQQAVSKRVAALEKSLGVRLFARTARGVQLTADGQAFLPPARELLAAEKRAAASVRPGHRALRVDVVGRRLGPASLLRDFHRTHPGTEVDIVTVFDATAAIAAVRDGTIDASFRALTVPAAELPDGVEAVRVFDEPVQLLTGPGHKYAAASAVRPTDLAGQWIWMPGVVPGTEWGDYYEAFARSFGLTIDTTGPSSGTEPLLDVVAASPAVATLVGERTHLLWPDGYDLRRIALRDPTPVYPHSLIWRAGNKHPALGALRDHLGSAGRAGPGAWVPPWAAGQESSRMTSMARSGRGGLQVGQRGPAPGMLSQ